MTLPALSSTQTALVVSEAISNAEQLKTQLLPSGAKVDAAALKDLSMYQSIGLHF